MSRYLVVVLSIVVMAATAVLAGACGMQPGGTQQQVGKLHITGGADQLMDGDFSYNVSEWKPKVSYDVSGQEGELLIKQGGANSGSLGAKARNEWDIGLNEEVPTDLVVKMGAGESDLDLDSLTLKGLDLQMGAGKSTVDLTGDYAKSFDASIQGGVGEATVLLPSGVGVKA